MDIKHKENCDLQLNHSAGFCKNNCSKYHDKCTCSPSKEQEKDDINENLINIAINSQPKKIKHNLDTCTGDPCTCVSQPKKQEKKVGLYQQVEVGEQYDCGSPDCKKTHIKLPHSNPSQPKEDWREEIFKVCHVGVTTEYNYGKLVQFISNLLAEQRAEVLKEIEGEHCKNCGVEQPEGYIGDGCQGINIKNLK